MGREAEAAEAGEAEAAAEGGLCGGTEYTTAMCIALIAEIAFVVLGVTVYAYMSFF